MRCAYCGNETTATREHIISSGILDLFPECYLTIDGKRNVIHEADPMVKDVCADCNNNRISYIDSYAKEFVQKYFLQKYSEDATLDIEYDYTTMQKMLLKYAFNDLRSRKEDYTFFNETVINFLLNQESKNPLNNVYVLGGLAVNTSPAPDYMFGNLKLQWSKSPMLLKNSIVQHLDYETGQIFLRENMEVEKFEGLLLSYIFRFNSGQFILLCWDENCPKIEENMKVIEIQYPYAILNNKDELTPLMRCTNETTYHHIQLVDVNWGNAIMDEISAMRKLASKSSESIMKEINEQWEKEEARLAKEHQR
jgi:hypothetical protein